MIEVFIDSRNFGNKGSGWSVILKSDKHVWERSFACGSVTANMAALQALQYALKSIKKDRRRNTSVIINNKYAQSMLEKDDKGYWNFNPKTNVKLIEAIRKACEEYEGVEILTESENPLFKRVKKLTEMAVKENKPVYNRS